MVISQEVELLRSKGARVDVLWFDNDEYSFFNLLLLPFNFLSYIKMRKKLQAFRPDVVHVHNLHFAGSAAVLYAIKSSDAPIVMTLHNYRMVCPSGMLYANGAVFLDSLRTSFPWKAVWKGVYKNRLVSFWLAISMQLHKWLNTWKMVDRYIVLTENARRIILSSSLRLQPERVIVKPNFSPAELKIEKRRSPVFLYVGRLSEEKGIEVLLKAFSLVDFKLCIAGDGPLVSAVQEAVASSPNIEYLGKKNKAAINELMSSCSALVFTSNWYEGMPLTIIESFSSGLPVIASRLGAMESMVKDGHNGLYFKVNDPNDLAQVLRKWASLPAETKQEFSDQARLTYEQTYTPERNAAQLLDIYDSVISAFNIEAGKSSLALPALKDRA